MSHQQQLQKWLNIRKELYRQTEAEVQHRLGRETKDLIRYRKDYEREFVRRWVPSQKAELIEKIRSSRLVLMGDFHALQQSQKSQLRLLTAFSRTAPFVLALECFYVEDQALLESYLQGKKTEKEFLAEIKWEARWGFPWENYRPLLRWAQKHKIPVYGLNQEVAKYSAVGLKIRDQVAARKICDILKQHPERICYTIYGDLHLAKKHLPQEIYRVMGSAFEKKTLRIFQNAERIYFQLLAKDMETSVDVVKLSRQDYCLLSVPPWVKWQNYLLYLEQAYDVELSDDVLDYTDHVVRYVKIIAEELGAKISLDRIAVYTAQDPLFWKKVEDVYSLKQRQWLERMIEEGRSFYLPEMGVGYLARASVNHAATLAMQFVQGSLAQRQRFSFAMPDEFLAQIWIEAVAYFGSKIINHKRKTDTIADLKASLAARSPEGTAKDPLKLALSQKMHELLVLTGRAAPPRTYQPQKKWIYMQSASLLGGILGERLYFGYRKRLISSATLLNLLQKRMDDPGFAEVYYEMLEIVESLPVPFRSKREKL